MKVANVLAYYDTATITALKCFIIEAPGDRIIMYRKWTYYSVSYCFFVMVSQFHWF